MTLHPTPHTRIWVIPVGAWCLDTCPSGWVPVVRVGMVIVAPTSALSVTRYTHTHTRTHTHTHTHTHVYVYVYIGPCQNQEGPQGMQDETTVYVQTY
jgi:hypothetical protein